MNPFGHAPCRFLLMKCECKYLYFMWQFYIQIFADEIYNDVSVHAASLMLPSIPQRTSFQKPWFVIRCLFCHGNFHRGDRGNSSWYSSFRHTKLFRRTKFFGVVQFFPKFFPVRVGTFRVFKVTQSRFWVESRNLHVLISFSLC